jgi:acyl carrier protein
MLFEDPTKRWPMPNATKTKTKTKAQVDAEGVMLELLADLRKTSVEELRQELRVAGEGMPVDSLDMFDVLVEFRQRTGITIDKKQLRRSTMRSVEAFAQFATKDAVS